MDQNFFSQNPAFQNILPEKLAFLMNFMNQEKPNSSRDMIQSSEIFNLLIWKFINLVNNFCGKVSTGNQKNNPYFY